MRSQYVCLAFALAGCASAESQQQGVGVVDSGVGGGDPDAAGGGNGDAAPGTSPDAAPPACTTMTRDLLTNPTFEGTPAATGWTPVPTVANDVLVGSTGGIAAHSPTMRAWLGGVAQANATDRLYQDVLVPASTSMLVLTGFYEVRTSESGATIYDRGTAEIQTTAGARIELIKSLDNAHPTTAWTPLDYTFANVAQMKGQTVRINFTTTNDGLNSTSFYFDTLHLNATVCE